MSKRNKTGIVYLMTCAQPYVVKIGRTEDENSFRTRMNRIEKDGYENFNGWKRKFAIRVDDYEEKEALLHNVFAARRIGKSEAFVLEWEIVQQLMSALEGDVVYPEGESKDAAFDEAVAQYDKEKKDIREPDETAFCSSVPGRDLKNVSEEVIFHYRQKTKNSSWHAKMKVVQGQCVVLAGSVLKELNPNSTQYVKNLRAEHSDIISPDDVLLSDVPFSKPSRASSFAYGGSSNGWSDWKDEHGKTLEEYALA